MTESMGYKGAMAINPIGGGTTVFNGSSIRLEYLSHSLKETTEIVSDEGLRGTRVRNIERVATGNVHVGGQIHLQPNVVELEAIMPFILGTASSAGSYVVADTLPDLYVMIDNVAEVDTYLVRVTKATFNSGPGQRMDLLLDVVGKTLTVGASGSFPGTVPAINIATRAYQFYDTASGLTVNSINYSIDKFSLAIDNKIVPSFMMAPTATDLEPTDRVITLGVQTKYVAGTETALFTDNRAGTARTANISFTNGANTFSFTFGNLLASAESVVQPGRQHLRFPLNYQAYGISTTKDIVVTLPA